jgi:hypothetical protein
MLEDQPFVSDASKAVEIAILQRKNAIDNLQRERVTIIQHFSDKILQLANQQELELQRNAQQLLDLGLLPQEIPNYQSENPSKIDSKEFQRRLGSFMQEGEKYSSTELCKHLGITYPIFKRLVRENPDFIEFQGINKGRTYHRKPPTFLQGQE